MYKLGIHHMSALEADPLSFVSLVAEAGCNEISVFTQAPGSSSRFPLVTTQNLVGMKARLEDTGKYVTNVDAFIISPTQISQPSGLPWNLVPN